MEIRIKQHEYKTKKAIKIFVWSKDQEVTTKQVRKDILPELLKQLKIEGPVKLNFSKYAGCSMCPCSPGWIISNGWYHKETEVHVTMPGYDSKQFMVNRINDLRARGAMI